MEENARHIDRMYADIEWAISQGLPIGEIIPMVERLMRKAAPQSLHSNYAKRQLAELIVRNEPFRAARLASEVLAVQKDDDRAHAVLGLACMLMGHYRRAESAYRAALAIVPHCPWYAHNLGHLLDVALNAPGEALHWLALSRRGMPHEPEIKSSYAHALLRAGKRKEAENELLDAFDGDSAQAAAMMNRWVTETAVSRE